MSDTRWYAVWPDPRSRSQALRHLQKELATDHGFLNYCTISTFVRAGFLIFVIVFVSRDFALGRNGALWVHCWGLALADFWRNPPTGSSDSLRGSRNFVDFCLVNNAWFRRFPLFHKSYPRSFTFSYRSAFTDFSPHRFFWANRFF